MNILSCIVVGIVACARRTTQGRTASPGEESSGDKERKKMLPPQHEPGRRSAAGPGPAVARSSRVYMDNPCPNAARPLFRNPAREAAPGFARRSPTYAPI